MMLMMAQLAAKPEKQAELVQALRALHVEIRQLPGCLESVLGRDLETENRFFLSSLWESRPALDGYLVSEHFGVLLGVSGLLAMVPEFRFLNAAAAGAADIIEQARGRRAERGG